MEYQKEQPVINGVEVLNGKSFRDVVLKPRLEPLLRASTLEELLAAVDPVQRSLRLFAANPAFTVDLDNQGTPRGNGILRTKTIVDLTSAFPSAQFGVGALTYDRDHAALSAQFTQFNQLGLAESLNLRAQVRPQPYALGAGSAELQLPTPTGAATLRTLGFFHNEDRSWVSYAVASHGIAAFLEGPLGTSGNLNAEVGIEAVARNVHSIKDSASDPVRAAAGGASSTLKVAATAAIRGPGIALSGEVAGKPGDANHIKVEAASSRVFEILPTLTAELGGSVGYLHTRTGTGAAASKCSDLLDRFVLGGGSSLTDPRRLIGSKRGGLGPVEGTDGVSADHLGVHSFWVGRAALHSKVPFTSSRFPDSPLRLTALLNAGAGQLNSRSTVASNLRDLAGVSPFIATAGGLTYSTGPASMELLYVTPLQTGTGDVTRPGLQIGVELNLA